MPFLFWMPMLIISDLWQVMEDEARAFTPRGRTDR